MVRELSREPAMFQIGVQGEVLIFSLFSNYSAGYPGIFAGRSRRKLATRKLSYISQNPENVKDTRSDAKVTFGIPGRMQIGNEN